MATSHLSVLEDSDDGDPLLSAMRTGKPGPVKQKRRVGSASSLVSAVFGSQAQTITLTRDNDLPVMILNKQGKKTTPGTSGKAAIMLQDAPLPRGPAGGSVDAMNPKKSASGRILKPRKF